ncbi:MAG: DMT family transporter [Agathobacter sp.]
MKKAAPFLIVLAGVLWGSMGLFVRTLNEKGLQSMDIVALRAVVTAVALFVFLLFYDRRLFRIRVKDLWCFLGTGICSILFFNYCYFKAIMLTSLSVAAVLLYTAPAFVMVLSFFLFKEKLTKRKCVSLVMTFASCVLVTGIVGDSVGLSAGGLLAGLGAGFGYALYSIFGRYALEKGYHSLTITFYTFVVAAVGTFFLADIPRVAETVTADAPMLLFAVAFGVLCTVVPYLTYTIGLKYVENSKASIIASIEPVTATLLGCMCFHEEFTVEGILGSILVLCAMIICREKK